MGIGVASTVAVVQTLVYSSSEFKNPKWQRADFTILVLSQAGFNFLGLLMSAITSVTTDDIQTLSPKYSKVPLVDNTNAGMLASAALASAIAAFNMAIMNYPTYGFPILIVTVMVRKIITFDNSVLKYSNSLCLSDY